MLTISVVLYDNDPGHLDDLVKCIQQIQVPFEAIFIDNSASDQLKRLIPAEKHFRYLKTKKNLGYGAANNLAITQYLGKGKYHLVMNPDVYFEPGTIEVIHSHMEANPQTGLVMPRVLHPDGSDQRLYKLLPRPFTLIARRFLRGPFQSLFIRSLERYEMSFASPNSQFSAPYLSGCFMWMRKEALQDVGYFDEGYFLYFEDVDLSRRIRRNWRNTYLGTTCIYHYHQQGSYKSRKLLIHHLKSAWRYFNKYGWWLDKEREDFNKATIAQMIDKPVKLLSPQASN